MRRTLFLIWSVFLIFPSLISQTQIFHADHTIFGINKLPPHADYFAYETEEIAAVSDSYASDRFLSLNGNWKFHWVRSPIDRPVDFYTLNYDDSNWDQIAVPANWEVEGYGHPIYLDIDSFYLNPGKTTLSFFILQGPNLRCICI